MIIWSHKITFSIKFLKLFTLLLLYIDLNTLCYTSLVLNFSRNVLDLKKTL